MDYNDETLVSRLTLGQLKEVIRQIKREEEGCECGEKVKALESASGRKYVYGLRGIRQLFGVSHATAQRYKNTFLRDAVSQQGQIIITDVDKAMELFKNHK